MTYLHNWKRATAAENQLTGGRVVGMGKLGNWDWHIHSASVLASVLAWRIPGTGEAGGLPSMGSHRVRHDWSDLAAAAAYPFNLVFLVLPPPNLYGSINILASISAVFIQILKYIQTSLSFHQCEHHIWCNRIIRWLYWGAPLLLPCQILTAPIMLCHWQGSWHVTPVP